MEKSNSVKQTTGKHHQQKANSPTVDSLKPRWLKKKQKKHNSFTLCSQALQVTLPFSEVHEDRASAENYSKTRGGGGEPLV